MTPVLLTVKCLLLAVSVVTGVKKPVCPQTVVEAADGGNVTLDCHLEPGDTLGGVDVEWKLNNSRKVLVIRNAVISPHDQDKLFRDRAEFVGDWSAGILSVRVTSVNETYRGNYSCIVGNGKDEEHCSIELIIKSDTRGIKQDPSPSSPPEDPSTGDGGLGAGPIAGIVITGIVITALIAAPIAALIGADAERRDQVPTEPPGPAPGEPNIPGGGPGCSAHQRRDADHSDGADSGDGNSGRAKRRKRTSPKHSKRGRKTQKKKRKNHY